MSGNEWSYKMERKNAKRTTRNTTLGNKEMESLEQNIRSTNNTYLGQASKRNWRRLNLGSGPELFQGFENADKFYKHPLVTYCDIDERLPWKDNTFNYIWTRHTLEHGKDKRHTLQEIYRILKPNGRVEIIVPHVLDNLQLGDVGHYSMFSTHTFAKLNQEHKRQYSQGMTWEIELIEFENVQPMCLLGFYNKHKHIAENYMGRLFPPRSLHVIMKAIK